MLDVIVIGGSAAGLSAALILGRALRSVLVIDSGTPCNRVSHASHGFLTRDGVKPSELLHIGREQIAQYETVSILNAFVVSAAPADEGFIVETRDGETFQARKLLLATGLRDELPDLPGIENFWGTSVFHCPYCDGWEVRNQAIAIYGPGETLQQVKMLRNWTPHLTICTGGEGTVPDENRALFTRHGIEVNEKPIARLEGEGDKLRQIVFSDHTTLAVAALFIRPDTHHQAPFAHNLGSVRDENGKIQVDIMGHTSVPGVYAAGDMTSRFRSVAVAVASGAQAAYGISHDLIAEDYS
jgi:thioredoxin reductase